MLLRQNASDCGMTDRLIVQAQRVEQFLSRPDRWSGPYDLAFADPPYAVAHELESMFATVDEAALLAPDAWLMIEHANKTRLPAHLGRCRFLRGYRYGDTALSLYTATGAA